MITVNLTLNILTCVSLSEPFVFFQPRDRNSSVGGALIEGRVGSGGARSTSRVLK